VSISRYAWVLAGCYPQASDEVSIEPTSMNVGDKHELIGLSSDIEALAGSLSGWPPPGQPSKVAGENPDPREEPVCSD
jgi:hypothetical protein